MKEIAISSPEQEQLPSLRYDALEKLIPGLQYTLTALDRIATDNFLSRKDTASLLAFSLWVEAPDAQDKIAQLLQVTPEQLRLQLDHVTDNLEDAWEQLDTTREELLNEEAVATNGHASEEDMVFVNSIPIFETPVKRSSGKTVSYNLGLIEREEILFEQFEALLDVREMTVTRMTLSGANDEEIQRELGLSFDSVVRIRSKARQKIENEILTPAGFFRLRRNGRRSQEVVVSRGEHAEGVNLLGTWYGTAEGAEVFDQRSRKVDAEMIEQGLEPVGWYVDWHLRREYRRVIQQGIERGVLVEHNNRWYGKKEVILTLMQEGNIPMNVDTDEKAHKWLDAQKPAPDPWIPPEPNLKQILEVAENQRDRLRFARAARREKIYGVKKSGRWFVDPLQASEYLAPPEPGLIWTSEIAESAHERMKLREAARREKIYAVKKDISWFVDPIQARAYLTGKIIEEPMYRS